MNQEARVLPMRIGRPDTQDPSDVIFHDLCTSIAAVSQLISETTGHSRNFRIAEQLKGVIESLQTLQSRASSASER